MRKGLWTERTSIKRILEFSHDSQKMGQNVRVKFFDISFTVGLMSKPVLIEGYLRNKKSMWHTQIGTFVSPNS